MKTKYKAIAALCVMGALLLAGCRGETETPSGPDDSQPSVPAEPVIVITATVGSVTLKDTEVSSYDYTALFTVTKDGENVPVLSEYVDSTLVSEAAGVYPVTCRYGGKHNTVTVNVTETVYTVESDTERITLRVSQVAGYDFKQHFTAKTDGAETEITDEMFSSDVQAKAGDYSVTVTNGGASKTVIITVEEDVRIVPAYRVVEIPIDELASYDYSSLFSLYADGQAVNVADAEIDPSALSFAETGNEYQVGITYRYEGKDYTGSAVVRVVEKQSYTVSTKNVVTYPHGENIDLTTLFEIKKGDQSVPVTFDMISGGIDYTKVGVNVVTLHFDGKDYESTVEVKFGVILDYAGSDTVTVKKGTDKKAYPFANDFEVIINGIPFRVIPESAFVGLDELDFTQAGRYDVTLRIAYNVNPPQGLFGNVEFEYVEKTITYVVEERTVEAAVKEESVTVQPGTTEYNPFSNLTVTVNGIVQFLTDNPEWADGFSTCYATLLSDPIDFTSSETQEVRIAVYANGDGDPVELTYSFAVRTDVVITAKDVGVFTGSTLYPTDLFTVTENGEPVEVTFDMISGKADTFRSGVYQVECAYGGQSETATVTVFDSGMKGTYRTLMTTIPYEEEDDSDDGSWGDGEDWGDYGEYSIAETGRSSSPVYTLDNLVIADDGSLTWGNRSAEITGGIDENTLLVKIGSYDYTLYYHDGIVVLEPFNTLKMAFTDDHRPMIFFNEAQWEIAQTVTINYSSQYVLAYTFVSYSIDTFRICGKEDERELWYGLRTDLVEKTSADTLYTVSWGEVGYADGFTAAKDETSSLTFRGEELTFVMQTDKVGKVARSSSGDNKYAGKTYRGTLNGQNANFSVSQSGTYELTAGGKRIFYMGQYDVSNAKNCYVDPVTDRIFLYQADEDETFSYLFQLDPVALTFTVLEKDAYYGMYKAANKFIFLDGYGTGIINFDSSTYSYTQLRYTVQSGVVSVKFVNTKPSFTYGSEAEFYLGEFLNTLSVKSFADDSLDGLLFENTMITDGAIVRISGYRFGADVTRGPDRLLDAISIVTKDGMLTGDAKRACIDMSAVAFNAPGFHRFSVNFTVQGELVTAYYTVQIVPKLYEGNALFATYGAGVLLKANSLSLDEYGQVTLNCAGVRLEGFATLETDGKISVKAYSESGAFLKASCEKIADGILRVVAEGAVGFTDYYTTGTSRVVAINGTALREFTVGNTRTYVLSGSASLAGDVVTVEPMTGSVENGNVVKITNGEKITYLRILEWGNLIEGLVILQDYEGA